MAEILTLKSKRVQKFIIIFLFLGIFFRFYNLEGKVYWHDETMTSLRISGYTQTELKERVFNAQVISVENLLQKYQYPNPEKDLKDTIKALAGNPEHSPLYYLLARFWLQTFGNSVGTIRLLSALISLLVLPCTYWLCMELFGLESVAWGAVILLAISPFQVLYAQEAREYSLWSTIILLSGGILLRAMRLKNLLSWTFYGIVTALGFYTHTFFAFVSIGHGIYVAAIASWRGDRQLRNYFFSSLLGILLFFPWLLVIIINFSHLQRNTAFLILNRQEFLPLHWGLNLSRIFFDFNQGLSPFSPLHYLSALLAGYSIYFIYRQGTFKAKAFILTLIGMTAIGLIVPDIILGSHVSSIARYGIPCYLGIQIAVAYLLVSKIEAKSKRWRYIAIAILLSGVLSGAVSSHYSVWWNKSYAKSRYNPQIAKIINQSDRSLIISDELPGRVISLCHLLKPNVKLQLLVKPNIPEIPNGFSNVFLYRPSEELKQSLEKQQNHKLENIYKSWLWRLSQSRSI